jgi:Spy/CpxP family protein refolding chaperone
MNRSIVVKGIGIATLAALALTLSASGVAAQTDEPAGGAVQQAPAAPRQPAPPAAGAAQRQDRPAGLNLTDEQKTTIKALRDQQQADLKTTREALRTARQQLADARKAEPLDEKALRTAASALATAQADETVLRARHRAQYLGVLTPEQREIAKRRQAAGMRAERQMRGFQARQLQAWRQARRGAAARGMRPGMGPGMGMGFGRPGAEWGRMWNGRPGMQGPMGPPMMGPGGFRGPGMMGPGLMGPAMRWRQGPGQPPAPLADPATPPAPPPVPKKKL